METLTISDSEVQLPSHKWVTDLLAGFRSSFLKYDLSYDIANRRHQSKTHRRETVLLRLEEDRNKLLEKKSPEAKRMLIRATYGIAKKVHVTNRLDRSENGFTSIYMESKKKAIAGLSQWGIDCAKSVLLLSQYPDSEELLKKFWGLLREQNKAENKMSETGTDTNLYNRIKNGVISTLVLYNLLNSLGLRAQLVNSKLDMLGCDMTADCQNGQTLMVQLKSKCDQDQVGIIFFANITHQPIVDEHGKELAASYQLRDLCRKQTEASGCGMHYIPIWAECRSEGCEFVNQLSGQLAPEIISLYDNDDLGLPIRALVA